MSTINTNAIDVNYPVPGVNNSSQGFRNNFTAIRNNLNVAANEISDLQNKVVVKAALENTVLNNDMANTLISNASTRSFRATTYNLGNALSGTVLVDVSLGDVQYGTVAGNVTFQFGGWAPVGTQSNVELQLSISNSSAVISWPAEVVFSNNNYGVTTLENYANVSNVATITVPYGVSRVDYRLNSLDCGNTVSIEPYNRPRQSTQIQQRTPSPVGFQGDVTGTVCIDPSINQLPISNTTTTTNLITTSGNTTQLYKDLPLVFTGNTTGTGLTAGTTYYVRNVFSSTEFTVSSSIGGANVSLTTATPTIYANPARYLYVCTDDYNASIVGPKTVLNTTGTLALSSVDITGTAGQFSCSAALDTLVVGQPVVVSGTLSGTGTITGYTNPTTYYIIATNGSTTFTLSSTLNGSAITTTAGTTIGLTFTVGNIVNNITLNNTTSITENCPIIFTGNVFGGVTADTVYYVKSVSSPNITISQSRTNGVADSTVELTTASGACSATIYTGLDIWRRINLNSW